MTVHLLFLAVLIVAVPVAYWGGRLAAIAEMREKESEEDND
ncbi:MAG: hypothetical protein WC655_26340 [Candidatus Hydrogenedentales bacterium]|jgi:hypothetical protein